MIKFRLYLDKDAETKWLNKMAEKGYAMTRFAAGFYKFEKSEPGQYIYQVDFGSKFFSVTEEYREFMEAVGVEIVQTWGFWVFLRKAAAEGDFQLYTDVDSSIEHYSKIRKMLKIVGIIEILIFISEVMGAAAGSTSALAGCFLIGALALAILNAVLKTNRVIAELLERKGEKPKSYWKQNVSPLLPCGLLLNCCALIIAESVDHRIKIAVQILAVIFMLTGVYQTARKK